MHPEHTKYVLIIDEVHEIHGFAQCVKSLWDDNRKLGQIRFVLMGSSPLLIEEACKGSKLSKCGRVISWPHWSFREVNQAFGCDLETYLFFGGYPGIYGTPSLEKDGWRSMIQHSIIDPSLERDIMKMDAQIDADLLKSLFRIVTEGSATVRGIKKITDLIGGGANQATIKSYLGYLQQACFITRIPVFTKQKQLKEERSRTEHSKLIALNTALVTAQHVRGEDDQMWGRVVETAVGAYLYGLGYGQEGCGKNLYYWRDDKKGWEIDYVIEDRDQDKIAAFEVKKSFANMKKSDRQNMNDSMKEFEKRFGVAPLKVGKGGDITLEDFLSQDPQNWLEKRRRQS